MTKASLDGVLDASGTVTGKTVASLHDYQPFRDPETVAHGTPNFFLASLAGRAYDAS
jgi:hypothetical protein